MQMLSPGYVDSTLCVNKEIMQVFKKRQHPPSLFHPSLNFRIIYPFLGKVGDIFPSQRVKQKWKAVELLIKFTISSISFCMQ